MKKRSIIRSIKLTKDNHCLVYPLIKHGDKFICENGWKILGEDFAPYPNRLGGSLKAVLFEKTIPRQESLFDSLADLEPGVYWCHGNISDFIN